MYFCNIETFDELIKHKPKVIEMKAINVDGRGLPNPESSTDLIADVEGYKPITSCLVRDMYRMWEHVIKKRDYLCEMGY